MAVIKFATGNPPLGQLGGPVEPWPLSVGIDPLDLGAHRGKAYLLVAEPVNPTAGPSLGLYGPLGDMLYPEGGEWGWKGLRQTLYPAATRGRSSRNDDTPAATWVPSKLETPNNFGSSLFSGVDPLSRTGAGEGELVLYDPDGELDVLLDYVWDSAPLTLKRGVPGTNFSTWETVGRFTAAGLIDDLDTKRIRLRDLGWRLSGLLHTEYYGGTGGLDGDAEKRGVWKPYAVGYVFRCEPVLINAALGIWQFSCAASTAVTTFLHGGVPLPFHADYATYDALAAAVDALAIPSGKYATCLAKSLVAANVDIQFGIRLEVIGDSEVSYGHPAPTTRAAIVRRVATTRGASRIDDAAEIDIPSFNQVEAMHAGPCGWYWSAEITKAAALDEILAGILGFWRVRPDGQLSIGYVDDPARGSIMNLAYRAEGMGMPRVIDRAPPRAGTFVGWRRNYAPQPRNELAGSVDDETAAIEAAPSRYAQALSPHIPALHPTAPVVTIEGGFRDEADAVVECSRQQALLSVERKRWQWDLLIDPHVDLEGKVVTITGVNRVGLGAAKPLLAVGKNAPGDGTVIFDWWG